MSSVITRNSACTRQDYRSEVSTRLSSTYPDQDRDDCVSEVKHVTNTILDASIAARNAFLQCSGQSSKATHGTKHSDHISVGKTHSHHHFSRSASTRTNRSCDFAQRNYSSFTSEISTTLRRDSSSNLPNPPQTSSTPRPKDVGNNAIYRSISHSNSESNNTIFILKPRTGHLVLPKTLRSTYRGVGRISGRPPKHRSAKNQTWSRDLSWRAPTERVAEIACNLFCLRRQANPEYLPTIATMEKHGYNANPIHNHTYHEKDGHSSINHFDTLSSFAHRRKEKPAQDPVSTVSCSQGDSQEYEGSYFDDQGRSGHKDHTDKFVTIPSHIVTGVEESGYSSKTQPDALHAFKYPVITTGIEPKRVFSALLRNIEMKSKEKGKLQTVMVPDQYEGSIQDSTNYIYDANRTTNYIEQGSLTIGGQKTSYNDIVSLCDDLSMSRKSESSNTGQKFDEINGASSNSVEPEDPICTYKQSLPPSYTPLSSKDDSPSASLPRNSNTTPTTISGRPPRFPMFEQGRVTMRIAKENCSDSISTVDVTQRDRERLQNRVPNYELLEEPFPKMQHKRRLVILKPSQAQIADQVINPKTAESNHQNPKYSTILCSPEPKNRNGNRDPLGAGIEPFYSKAKLEKFDENRKPKSNFVLNGEDNGSAFI